MTDRTITLTPTEAEKFKALAVGESMWIVRAGYDTQRPPARKVNHPPAEFVQACAPCETCDNGVLHKMSGDYPCGDCCIEMVGPCPNCPTVGKCAVCGSESIFTNGTVTLGYAYTVAGPILRADDGQLAIEVRKA